MRTDVDYGDFEYISKDDAEEAYKNAVSFIEIITTVKKRLQEELNG